MVCRHCLLLFCFHVKYVDLRESEKKNDKHALSELQLWIPVINIIYLFSFIYLFQDLYI